MKKGGIKSLKANPLSPSPCSPLSFSPSPKTRKKGEKAWLYDKRMISTILMHGLHGGMRYSRQTILFCHCQTAESKTQANTTSYKIKTITNQSLPQQTKKKKEKMPKPKQRQKPKWGQSPFLKPNSFSKQGQILKIKPNSKPEL